MEENMIVQDGKKEVINLEEDSSEEEDDNLRPDMYEDYDELADLAVTASEEPPPPGTRPLQEELMTLITENTVSGVTINKDDVVAWLRNEEAALTGEIIPHRLFPSPPSSSDKLSENEDSDASRSGRWPLKKKSKSLRSVAVRREHHEESHHKREGAHHKGEGTHHRSDRSYKRQDGGQYSDSHPRRSHISQNGQQKLRNGDRNLPDRSNREASRGSDGRSPARQRHDKRRQHSGNRQTAECRDRQHSGNRQTAECRDRQTTVRRQTKREHANRRVKLQHKIEDDERNSSKNYHKEVLQPARSHKVQEVRDARSHKVQEVRDARELLSEKRSHVPVTEYVKSLKEQIRCSEANARNIFKELQSTKKDLMTYLRESDGSKGENNKIEHCKDRDERRRENTLIESRTKRKKSRVESRPHDRRRSSSPVSEKKRSSCSPDIGTGTPEQWKVLSPSQVDGFNCGGPALFVQNFRKDVSRKDLYSYFKHFGTVMDVKKLHIGKKRSACIIFSRQSEADRVLQSNERVRVSPIKLDTLTPPNNFDRLLNALQSEKQPTDIVLL